MSLKKKYTGQFSVLLTLIFAGEAIFFLPFILPRIFRPTLLRVFDISNLELGSYFSVYGLIAMASYFLGGPLADRFSARMLMSIALWLTAFGGVVMATFLNGNVLAFLYGYWGLTTILLFWAALIRSTREWGGVSSQGRAFGLLEGGRGLTSALLGVLALFILSQLATEGDIELIVPNHSSFQVVILVTSLITFISGLMVWWLVPDRNNHEIVKSQQLSLQHVKLVIRMPTIWMQAIIIICAYVGYKITDDFSLYANVVFGFNEIDSATIGTVALWMRPIVAIMAGFYADRVSISKVTVQCFGIMIVGGILIYLGWISSIVWLSIIVLASTLIGVYGIRAIYFALMQESKVPIAATGTAVGFMSVIGYTPDVFMSPLMGYLLDTFPGELGHQYVFLTLALFSIIGLLVSILLRKTLYHSSL